MTLLAALLLASCAPSHSTNNQTSASSTEVAKKNEISITISVTPEGQKAQSKTLKVAEESNLMKVLKANYKIEEKMAWSPRLTVTAKMKPKVFTGCTRSMAKWLQKVLLKPPLKRGQDRILSRSV